MTAVISLDRICRFELRRQLSFPFDPSRTVTWVMLNPSTADSEADDPTIRRCIAFSRQWGYDEMIVVNFMPIRSTNPRAALDWWRDAPPWLVAENLRYVQEAVEEADETVLAWGAHGEECGGDAMRTKVADWIMMDVSKRLTVLGWTTKHQPRHPLYVSHEVERTSLIRGSPDCP